MNKQEFLSQLRNGLSGLPQNDIEERLSFYNEMIEDRMEDDAPEEEAVEAIGTVDEIVAQIILDTPLTKIAREKIRSTRRLKVWEILLLCLGSPIWLSLVIAIIAVIISLYASLWVVIISLWAIFVSLIAVSLGGVIAGIIFALTNTLHTGLAVMGAAITCAGFAFLMFYGCKAASKATLFVTKRLGLRIKSLFLKKGDAE